MKKLLVLIIGLVLTNVVWAGSDTDVQQALRDMEARLQKQEQKISDLQRQLSEKPISRDDVSAIVREELDNTVDTQGWAQAKDVSPLVSLRSNITNLDIRGDLRVRWMNEKYKDDYTSYYYYDGGSAADDDDDGTSEWQGFQTRLRVGGVWTSNEGWEIGVGVVTGDHDNYGEAPYPYQTWNVYSPFDRSFLYLDYAYGKHTWENEGSSATLTIGQFQNPFVTSDILWDEDIRLSGAALTYATGGLFVTVGGFEVLNQGWNDTSGDEMVAAQLGYSGDMGDAATGTFAIGYYHYNDATAEDFNSLSAANNGYDYQIGDLYGALVFNANDDVALGVNGHIWKNFGADGTMTQYYSTDENPDSNDLGYVVGVTADFLSRYHLSADYFRVEADSAPWYFINSDLGYPGTDQEGYRLTGSVDLTKNLNLAIRWIDSESIDAEYYYSYEHELLLVDLTYLF